MQPSDTSDLPILVKLKRQEVSEIDIDIQVLPDDWIDSILDHRGGAEHVRMTGILFLNDFNGLALVVSEWQAGCLVDQGAGGLEGFTT